MVRLGASGAVEVLHPETTLVEDFRQVRGPDEKGMRGMTVPTISNVFAITIIYLLISSF